jgi:uncharacterized protein (TIGR00369 family)
MHGAPNAERFPPLPPARAERRRHFTAWSRPYFVGLVGLELEEVRTDYARLRLPCREAVLQPHGMVHGGAIATLIDTVVVPAIGSAYDEPRVLLTISMQVNYLAGVAGEAAIAEGWVERRGRSTVFCRVEVRTEGGVLAATGSLVYKVAIPPAGAGVPPPAFAG